jgi:DNA-binding NarL/FixJ family response regulator
MGTTSRQGRSVGASKIQIVIVDPRPVVRLGIRALIADQPGLCIAAEAGDFRALMSILDAVHAGLVILDPELPDLRGPELFKKLREAHPQLPILVFNSHRNSSCVLEAIRHGAQGYLTKDAESAQVLEAIRVVMAGDAYLDPRVASLIIDVVGNGRDDRRRNMPLLTERERAVLNLLAMGKRNRDISEILFISEHTVKFHLTGLLQKLQANNRTDVVTKAINLGLISL